MAITVQIRTQITQLYTALFGRAPDVDGLGFWSAIVGNGDTLTHVADMMYATAPARAYYPGFFSNEEIIASFYRNVLGRTADPDGLAFWTAKLNATGATPGSVIVEMINNVATYQGTDPAGLLSQQLFNNKVTVGQHYAESNGGIDSATAILASITADGATVNAAIAGIDNNGVDAPLFSSATVNGGTLVLTYVDADGLDAAHPPATSAFNVKVAGTVVAVNAVAVDAVANTVTLTLATAVTSTQAVTVAYADPTVNNDANAIQDAAGHDAPTLVTTAVTNNTPANADTTAPVFASANVTGSTLVMTYTDANALDAVNIPAASAFTVMVAGSARAVTAVAVDANAKTVTLTLASAVTGGQAVTVAYADPTTGNDANAIQDAAGNDAASLAAIGATNNGLDVTGPVMVSASVNGATLVMTYDETLDPFHAPPISAFAVKVDGVARTVNAVAVDSANKTITLTLASAVANGQAVTVAYTDPTAGNDVLAINDALGNDALTLAATAVTNATPDTTAPVFASAKVNGSTLVMTYTELNSLDATHLPATTAFVVKVAGVARAVSAVAVNATAHTVTLTLASAVTNGQAVTVAYTDPTGGNDSNAIQDDSGNDAATLAATAVTNNTPDTTAPVFASATVDGVTLVMTYTELNTLDATHIPATTDFAVKVAGVARTVNSLVVDANAKTVTLTLASAVTAGQAVTVAYTDPSGSNDVNAIQDAAGNDAATLAATAVTNNTAVPDTTAPVFASATVDGASLVMTYTEANQLDAVNKPGTGAFVVKANGSTITVNSVAVDANLKTVTLTLASAVQHSDSVTVAYTDPTGGNDASAIQDNSGNDAATLAATAVTNNTVDSVAPVFSSASVDGATLVMTYTESDILDSTNVPGTGAFTVKANGSTVSVNSVAVDANAHTVTLTLASAVQHSDTVTVAYTDPSGANDANAIQDASGNDAATLAATAVTNNTVDSVAPVFADAHVNGNTVVMTYTESDLLDSTNAPAIGDFVVEVNGGGVAVNAVAVDANLHTVTLTLASAAANGDTVTVAYNDPTIGNDGNAIQDASGNDAATLATTPVTNDTPDTTAPVISTLEVNGNTLVLTYNELNLLDSVNMPGTGDFAVTVDAAGDAVTNIVVDGVAHTVTLTLTTAVTVGQTVLLSYTDPTAGDDANAIQDDSGNDAVSLVGVAVNNVTP